jgi:hypothetical protein
MRFVLHACFTPPPPLGALETYDPHYEARYAKHSGYAKKRVHSEINQRTLESTYKTP